MTWSAERDAAVRAARGAAEVIRTRRPSHVAHKGPVDLVTEVDHAAEEKVTVALHQAFPDDPVRAEEAGLLHGRDAARCWVVDPLDGTTNFVHGVEHVAVSIALLIDGHPVVGVVLDVFRDQVYTATAGGGAWRDGLRLSTSTTPAVEGSLLATGFPYDRRQRAAWYLGFVEAFLRRSQGIRRFGSAALDLASVARGAFDGYWESGLQPWDTAAGALLVTEAGGCVTGWGGAPYRPGDPWIVASNGPIHSEMLAVLAEQGGAGAPPALSGPSRPA